MPALLRFLATRSAMIALSNIARTCHSGSFSERVKTQKPTLVRHNKPSTDASVTDVPHAAVSVAVIQENA